MTIYFVRHGETAGNAQNHHQTAKTPLSEIGLSQAKLLAHRFKKIQIDRLIASDHLRTQQTAKAIAKTTKLQIQLEPFLREMRNPSVFEGKPYSDPNLKTIKEQMRAHQHDKNWHHSDEENWFDLKQRALKFINSLDGESEERLCAVTHGITLRMIAGVMLFGSEADMQTLEKLARSIVMTNTGITQFEWRDGCWQLICWNDAAHLG